MMCVYIFSHALTKNNEIQGLMMNFATLQILKDLWHQSFNSSTNLLLTLLILKFKALFI